jgi:uncharacterized protein (DUF1800 family)
MFECEWRSKYACAQSDMTARAQQYFQSLKRGPFIGKQLIQHLVTSNPSGAYVERVARVFNNDCDALYPQGCTSARGNLKAVVQAILLDPEARGDVKSDPHFGKFARTCSIHQRVLACIQRKVV